MGIYIEESKKGLFAQKLVKLFRESGVENIGEYYHYIAAPPITEKQKELQGVFTDTITVHKTNFFRENNHFEHIKKNIGQILNESETVKRTKELRVWSSACSTGEEAYTLAILLKEILPMDIRPKILATDISPQSLHKAISGEYVFAPEDNIPPYLVSKYFYKNGDMWSLSEEIKKLVTFRLFNLVDKFPFKNPFDIIFCRNVMIYFDREVQEKLVQQFYDALSANGLLFIGHSESLIQIHHKFFYYEPTIYKKSRPH
ncbi:MAG: protein-glutamate O-methyltransferase CheR [Candidatus Gastranaerophilales bacterium]|nr:protein-glutamate O-methyltransferase CheR [Candidatus Gastranaerophilales bacterium]